LPDLVMAASEFDAVRYLSRESPYQESQNCHGNGANGQFSSHGHWIK
jgi:hypothetical protein